MTVTSPPPAAARRPGMLDALWVTALLALLPCIAVAQETPQGGVSPGVSQGVSTQRSAVPLPAADTTTAATGARPITLAQAIELARQNSPTTNQARGTEQVGRAAVRTAIGSFLPSLSVSSGMVRQLGNGRSSTQFSGTNGTIITTTSRTWTYNNGFSVSTALFNPQNLPNLRAARAEVTAAQAATVTASYAVSLDVAQQYYNALSARESEDAARAQLAQAEQQLSASVKQVLAGAATRSDSLRSFVQVATARIALLTAHTNLRSANAALTRLIGAMDVVTATPEDTATALIVNRPPLDSITIVQWALAAPAIVQARAELAAAQQRRSAARATYLPTLNAGYSRSGSGTDSRFGLGSNPYGYNSQLSIALSYSIFNGFSREGQNVNAQVAENNATIAVRDAEFGARQLAVQYGDAVNTAREQVVAQQASISAAEEDLRVQQTRYDLGVATLLDVLTSQTQLNQARADLITARYNFRIAQVRVESLIGRDLVTSASSAALLPEHAR